MSSGTVPVAALKATAVRPPSAAPIDAPESTTLEVVEPAGS